MQQDKISDIIKCAIKGGYTRHEHHLQNSWGTDTYYPMLFCDPLFWQAIGRAKNWERSYVCKKCRLPIGSMYERKEHDWLPNKCARKWDGEYVYTVEYALRFYEINLTEGMDKAVDYLWELIKKE